MALHLGWRDTETGIRFASWAATGPLAIPDDLRLLMGASPDHTSGRIILPARVVQRIEHRFRIQAARDIALTEVKTALLAWLADRAVYDYGLAGIAVWTPGQEDPRTWERLAGAQLT